MTHTTFAGRLLAVAGAGALVLIAGAAPAAAQSDTSQSTTDHAVSIALPLERIGTQFVRGDNFTGAGVPAPSFIPEQR